MAAPEEPGRRRLPTGGATVSKRAGPSWPDPLLPPTRRATGSGRSRASRLQSAVVRFHVVQRFDSPLEAVESAFVDPAFLARLGEMPELGAPRLLDQRVTGCVVTQRVRYQFAGHVSGAVARVVDPAKLSWVEACCLDRQTHRAEHRILPEHYATRLQCTY